MAMFKALKKLLNEPASEHLPHREVQNLQLAVACLLHESKRVNLEEKPEEHAAAKTALVELFGVDEETSEKLLAAGRDKARRLTSYYGPISAIKRDYSLEQRIVLIEHLWHVAYADGRLDPEEDHYVRKIAHLLYVPNTQTMLARARARSENT
jgi:uncharacterized tellurite resistance protein B-like protein